MSDPSVSDDCVNMFGVIRKERLTDGHLAAILAPLSAFSFLGILL